MLWSGVVNFYIASAPPPGTARIESPLMSAANATNSSVSSPKRRRRVITIATAVAVALGGAGVAYAYWSSTGTGTGNANTSAGASNLAVAQTAAPTNMAPGVAPGAIAGTVTNNGVSNAYVNTVTVSITSVTPAGAGTCTAADYVIANASMSVATDVAPTTNVAFSGATIGFKNDPARNQDGCKGATVVLGYVVA